MKQEKEIQLGEEMVKAIEAGLDKHLKGSIKYAPFKLFLKMFREKNPELVSNIRIAVAGDIINVVGGVKDFSKTMFIKDNQLSPLGHELLKKCYNIGIYILKKRLTVVMAFRVVTNTRIRNQLYNFLLNAIEVSTYKIIESHLN
tara:strand:+ start:972 stop:1403 length:432 start_codon:yes stop_codon:yes gene_type:complete